MQVHRPIQSWFALVVCIGVLFLAGCGNDDQNDTSHDASSQPKTYQPAAQDAKRAKPLVSNLPDFSRLVAAVSPAVVNISALPPTDNKSSGTRGSPDKQDDLRQWLFQFFGDGEDGPEEPPPSLPDDGQYESLGSGFIISPDGYILTSRHVVADAGRIVVKLADHRQLLAEVVGSDPNSDIALLHIDAHRLPTARIGDSEHLKVGAWVVAIGSPFGFETSVTAGIVSAKGRSLENDKYVPFLQTDVAINPGNSGGPLFDLAGRVVGINAQIYSQTGGYQGLSFAIPINIAMHVAKQLQRTGHVTRGWLGVQVQDVDREMAKVFRLSRPEGALITQVFDHSPAMQSNLHVGDIILSFNKHPVDSAAALPPLVGAVSPGATIDINILRDGKEMSRRVRVDALPARFGGDGENQDASAKKNESDFALSVQPLTDSERQALNIEQGGVRITAIKPDAVFDAGLQVGDVILSVGTKRIASEESLRAAMQHADGPIALLVSRKGVQHYVVIPPGNGLEKPSK